MDSLTYTVFVHVVTMRAASEEESSPEQQPRVILLGHGEVSTPGLHVVDTGVDHDHEDPELDTAGTIPASQPDRLAATTTSRVDDPDQAHSDFASTIREPQGRSIPLTRLYLAGLAPAAPKRVFYGYADYSSEREVPVSKNVKTFSCLLISGMMSLFLYVFLLFAIPFITWISVRYALLGEEGTNVTSTEPPQVDLF